MGIYREELNILTNSPEEAAVLSDFGNILSAGGTDVTIVPEIQRVKFLKNCYNCMLGPMCALARNSMQEIFRKPADEHRPTANGVSKHELTPAQQAVKEVPYSFPKVGEYTIPWMYEILDEVKNLGQTLYPDTDGLPGIASDLPVSVIKATAEMMVKPESTERPSMLVDVEKGRPTEVEVVVGSLVKTARLRGVPMPVSHIFPAQGYAKTHAVSQRLETLYALMLLIQENTLYEYRKKNTMAV